jgi:hypothetical protein
MGVMGERGSAVVKVLRYKSEGRWFDSRMCHWNFSLTQSFRSHYGPGGVSASNRNEYQEHFLGGKGGWCVRLTTLPPFCTFFMKSRNLNFLEPSGPPQACNGTALPLPYLLNKYTKWNVWRLALRCDIYIYIYVVRFQTVKLYSGSSRWV